MNNHKTAKGEYKYSYTNKHGVDMFKVNNGYLSRQELNKKDGEYNDGQKEQSKKAKTEKSRTKKSTKKEIVAFEGGEDGFMPIYSE